MQLKKSPRAFEWNLNTLIQIATLVGMLLGGWTIWVNSQRDIDDMKAWRAAHEQLHKEALAERQSQIARLDERLKTLEDTKIKRDGQIEALQGKTAALEQNQVATSNTLRELSNKLNDVVADSRVSREILERIEGGQNRRVPR